MSDGTSGVLYIVETLVIAFFAGAGALLFVSPIIVRMTLPPENVTLPMKGVVLGFALIVVAVEMLTNRCQCKHPPETESEGE